MHRFHRLLVSMIGLMVVLALIAGCAAPAPTPVPAAEPAPTEAPVAEPAPTEEPAAEPTEAPIEEPAPTEVPAEAAGDGKTLVVGRAEDTVFLDPGRTYETFAGMVLKGLYQTLVTFPPDRVDEIIPDAAESWEISDDGRTYTFTLKDGQVFSTGRTMTAADAAFSIMRMKHIKGNPSFLADNIVSAEATDDKTLVITLAEPDPALLARLIFPAFSIIDSEAAKAQGATDAEDADQTDTAAEFLNQTSLGSGPYMLERWEPTVETIVVRNPEFAGTPATIDRVIYLNMQEASAQKLALEAGDLDIALDVTPDQVPSLKANPDLVVYEDVSDWVDFLLMNADPEIGGPMSDPLVQQAVRLALDYEGIQILAGGAAAVPVNIMPVHWPYALDQSMAVQRDVDAAKQLLADAGYPDGLDVTLEYSEFTIAGVPWSTLAQKVQADLAEAGINVTLKPGEIQTDLERYRNGEQAFSLWAWSPDFTDPIDRLAFTPDGKVGLRANWTGDKASPELMAAVDAAWVTSDPAEREQYFTEIQEIMLAESAFAFLVQPGLQVAYRQGLEGFAYSPQWFVDPYVMDKSE
jgi:peptide/nickel transport system substrate-binding protein